MTEQSAPGNLVSSAWNCRFGPRYDAGQLRLAGDRLSFETAKGMLFDEPLERFERLDFAWGGIELKVKVGGRKFKLVFSRPQGAPVAFAPAGGAVVGTAAAAMDVAVAVQAVGTLVDSAQASKAWREAIAARRGAAR